ncbi:hypothetical protein GCK72_007669 [Caenorhabditis remanei]|uniref:F-box domain-containing protein n=1 Tax=Caenorhabditis remanei TaxID=31234 RepID=A0A6A5HHW2_CAERE|nr:hypothetical protein GCK72_007669 [Caenorhabditis remanei]KAF1767710.1 hypothetical protein GCK72_007669 [Caenorhabditis remanei]
MSSKKPLSYPNWQCVIKYMNSNTRILLSQHCPELRRLEKSIPLKVRSFDFCCQDLIFLNDSVYRVGIFRQYHDKNCEIPEDIQWYNNNGGMRGDVDKYGFPSGYLQMDDDDLQKEKKKIQKRIKKLKKKLPGSARRLKCAVETLKYLNEIIFRFDLQSRNLEPPFTHYLQLSITPNSQFAKFAKDSITSRKNGALRTERLFYEQPLQNAQKYLIDKLFGGRSQIFICYMVISLYDQHFPLGSLLRVQHLNIGSYSFVHSQAKLESVVDYRNYPLKTLSSCWEELNHPIAATAQKLLFTGLPPGFPLIRHRNVQFTCYFDITDPVQQLVQHMLNTKKNIGVCYAFRCDFDFEKTELIDEIKETHEEKVKLFENSRNNTFSSCVVLQMTETSDLFVYWTNEKMNYLKIEVLPSGSPVPIEHD